MPPICKKRLYPFDGRVLFLSHGFDPFFSRLPAGAVEVDSSFDMFNQYILSVVYCQVFSLLFFPCLLFEIVTGVRIYLLVS